MRLELSEEYIIRPLGNPTSEGAEVGVSDPFEGIAGHRLCYSKEDVFASQLGNICNLTGAQISSLEITAIFRQVNSVNSVNSPAFRKKKELNIYN